MMRAMRRPAPPPVPVPPPRPTAGRPFPLGVTPDAAGANVAVFSSRAARIELCLFDPSGRETARLALPERTDEVFHGHLEGLRPGQVYGLRAHGPWDPVRGQRFNPNRLLLDPYARALAGGFRWEGPNLVDPADPFAYDPRDTAPFVPKAVLSAPPAPADPASRPGTAWDRTLVYEAHVKGLTRLHPEVPEAARGRYAGLTHPAVLEHLVQLGVTAVELLPVAASLDELRLARLGLVNHWGYNPLAFMAVEPRYASADPAADPAAEFRAMVDGLHAAGIEVILDVVFNHTAASDRLGPTLSFRGLDNAAYYRLDPQNPARYLNHAGTGNTLEPGASARAAAGHGCLAPLGGAEAWTGSASTSPTRWHAGPRTASKTGHPLPCRRSPRTRCWAALG